MTESKDYTIPIVILSILLLFYFILCLALIVNGLWEPYYAIPYGVLISLLAYKMVLNNFWEM